MPGTLTNEQKQLRQGAASPWLPLAACPIPAQDWAVRGGSGLAHLAELVYLMTAPHSRQPAAATRPSRAGAGSVRFRVTMDAAGPT